MAPSVTDIAGVRFGKLTVLRAVPRVTRFSRWLCACDCGKLKEADGRHLQDGNTKSCGCLMGGRRATTVRHDMWRSPEYVSWGSMIQRCTNPNSPSWPRYGGRGIVVCDSWKRFENFFADMGERGNGLTLDRIDNNGNYEPGNCRWATWSTQAINKPYNKGNSKLTREQADDIRRLKANGDTSKYIAEIFDVSVGAVKSIVAGRTWRVNRGA